jgi:hypothetical protein
MRGRNRNAGTLDSSGNLHTGSPGCRMNPAFHSRGGLASWWWRPDAPHAAKPAAKPAKIDLQLFLKWLKLPRLLDNLSFQGMENLQVNVVQ